MAVDRGHLLQEHSRGVDGREEVQRKIRVHAEVHHSTVHRAVEESPRKYGNRQDDQRIH